MKSNYLLISLMLVFTISSVTALSQNDGTYSDCTIYGTCQTTNSGSTYINNTNVTNIYQNVTNNITNNITTNANFTNVMFTNQSNNPNTDSSFNLGSDLVRWLSGYFDNLSTTTLNVSTKLSINSTSNNVGIGTYTPNSLLHVAGGAIQIGSVNNNPVSYSTAVDSIIFNRQNIPTSFQNKITNSWAGNINSTMNFLVDIGSSAYKTISFSGDGAINFNGGPQGVLGAGTNSIGPDANGGFLIKTLNQNAVFRLLGFGNDIYFDNTVSGDTIFRTNVSISSGTSKELGRFKSNGRFGIGTASPITLLDVNDTTIRFRASDNSSQGMCLNATQGGTLSVYQC